MVNIITMNKNKSSRDNNVKNKNKLDIHWIDNKPYYKQGGLYKPAKYDEGGYEDGFVEGTVNNVVNAVGGRDRAKQLGENYLKELNKKDESNWYHDPNTILGMSNAISAGINSLAKNPQQEATGKFTANQMNKFNKTGTQQGLGTALDAAAMLDPTGTSKIVNAGVKLASAAGNVINPGNKYGYSDNNLAEVAGNVLNPFKRVQQIVNTGKQFGAKEAVKDYLTFGVSGNKLQKEQVNKGLKRDRDLEMSLHSGNNIGNFKNNSVFAKDGAYIKSTKAKDNEEPNVEIEDGEIYIGDISNVKRFGNSRTSMESKYAAKFHGDKHGEDKDKDGKEGIPLMSEGAYIASNYLGVDGKKARDGKTVAKEMTPSIEYLANAEQNKSDKYKNNPVAIAYQLQTINAIKNDAERNKFKENLRKELNDKNSTFDSMLNFMKDNLPEQDMTSNQKQVALQTMNQLQAAEQQVAQDQYNMELNKQGYMPTGDNNQQPQMKQGGYNNINNNNNMSNYRFSNPMGYLKSRYKQEGGEVNQSEQAMNQMVQQAPSMNSQQQMNQGQTQSGMVEGLSEQSMQIFQTLPPEVQQQIMQMPVEQREQAVQQMAAQMSQMQGQAPQTEEISENQMRFGGNHKAIRLGEKVKYKCGGYMKSGTVTGYNPLTGKVKVQKD